MSSGDVIISNFVLPFFKSVGHRVLLSVYILVKVLVVILLILAQCLISVLQVLLIPVYALLVIITAPLRILILITKLIMTLLLFILLCPHFAWNILRRFVLSREIRRRRDNRRPNRLEYY